MGVDLGPCVHAHGHDVDPIMEASCNNNYFLDIISSGICELILCNRGSDHIFHLIPFLKQVKTLVFCRSYIPATPMSILLRVIPSSISRISNNCVASYEYSSSVASHRIQISPGFWLISHSRTPISESFLHSDSITLSNLRCLRF